MSPVRCSVLTPFYAPDPRAPEVRGTLGDWLAHLRDQSGPLELVLAGTAPTRRDPWTPLLASLAGADYPHALRVLHTPCRERPQSRAAALNAAARVAGGELLLLLHADVWLPPGGLDEVRAAAAAGWRCGAFPKRYRPSTPLLALQAAGLNAVALRLLGRSVGTNALWLGRELWRPLPDQRLLEDVWLADRLPRPHVARECVSVASDKYLRTGVAVSMALNALVLALARGGWARPDDLAEQLYSRAHLPLGSWRVWPALLRGAVRAVRQEPPPRRPTDRA